MAQVNVTIIGLGRVGASLGLAIRALNGKPENKHHFTVTGTDQSATRLKAASKVGALDTEIKGFDEAVEKADLVFIAVPYNTLKDVFEAIGPTLKAGAVVVDTAPLKQPSLAWADKYFPRTEDGDPKAYLVGITPMINPDYLGQPTEGTDEASADLFSNGQIVISPAVNCPPDAVKLVSDLTYLLGLKAHFVDPAEHDAMAASMESLPLFVQLGLFESIRRSPGWADTQWLGNPAFFLATYRLAGTDPESLAAQLHRNRTNVVSKVDALIESLTELRRVLNSEDASLLVDLFDSAMRDYAQWQFARQDNRFSTEKLDEEPVRVGFNWGLFPSFGGVGNKNKKKK